MANILINKNLNFYFTLFLIFIFGVLLRYKGLNFDSFWIDEIFSFWVADPSLDLKATLDRSNTVEGTTPLFNLILKTYYSVFGYEVKLSRYLPFTFSCLTLLSSTYLMSLICKNRSIIFFLFLVSSNIFLIRYSQELRVYSMLAFFSSLSIIYFYKIIDTQKNYNKIKLNILFFFLTTIITSVSHPLALILPITYTFFSFFYFIFYKFKFKILNFTLVLVFLFSFFYYSFFFQFNPDFISWIPQVKLKFFSNLFFSSFFGSRIMGLIYLFTLLFLIIKLNKIVFLNKKILFLIFLFILTYALPIIFGFMFYPIIGARYLIFIIIPIIALISFLTFELTDSLKKIFFFILFFSTLINVYDDVFDRRISKPDLNSVYKKIDMSVSKNIIFKLHNNNNYSKMKPALKKFTEKNNSNLKVFDQKNLNKKYFEHSLIWYICIYDLNGKDCSVPKNKKINILQQFYFNSIDLKLLEIN